MIILLFNLLMIKLFIVIAAVVIVYSSDEECSQYTDCFACNAKDKQCQWNNNKCQHYTSITSVWSKMLSCIDGESKKIIRTYCGEEKIELIAQHKIIAIPNINDEYGRKYLLCQYTFQNTNPKNNLYCEINISKKAIESVEILIDVTFKDGSPVQREIISPQYLVKIENAKNVTFYVYQSESFNEIPFTIELSLEKAKVSVTLIITIVLVIIVCIICGVSIYIFCQKINRRNKILARISDARNNSNELSRIREEERNNEQIIRILDEIVREARLKEIENLFTHVMKAIPFSSSVGKYNTSCSICLDEFRENHLVCVTECNHVFHFNCLKKWLITNVMNPKCPNCVCSLLKGHNDTTNITNTSNVITTNNNTNENMIRPNNQVGVLENINRINIVRSQAQAIANESTDNDNNNNITNNSHQNKNSETNNI